MRKATVVGVGGLGSCIAFEIANRGLVQELVLIDIYRDLAEGNALDITQALAFRNNTKIICGGYEDAEDSQVIVVTAGKPRTPETKSRMALLKVNKKTIETVASKLRKIGGEPVIVTLTNPVDLMNYLMYLKTGLERKRVLGSAGMLDSARFRMVLSRRYQTPILEVNAYVIGEHGNNQVPVFSQVEIKGEKKTFNNKERIEIMKELRRSALNVISKKGATIFAPANNTVNIVETILKNERKTVICSAIPDREYGLKNVSIGLPVTLGCKGFEKILEWKLDREERNSLHKGAERLKATLRDLFERA